MKIKEFIKSKVPLGDNVYKTWRGFLFAVFLAFIMIFSSHRADRKVHKVAQLINQVKELRSRLFDGRTDLMQLKMESNVVRKMKVKGLEQSLIPPKKILITKEEKE